ncbi:ComEC family competence protein [Candidatus Falkowbacteria bacterium]|nr:ComEC family competence protein [Candidatus Falkowbacteria bacterium]
MSGGGQFFPASRYWLAFVIGIALVGLWPDNWSLVYFYSSLLGILLTVVVGGRLRWPVLLFILCLVAGFWRAASVLQLAKTTARTLLCSGRDIMVSGQLASQPQTRASGGSQLIIKNVRYNCGPTWQTWPGRVLIYGPDVWLNSAQVGQTWQFSGRLAEWPTGGVFSYRYYLFNQGVRAVLKADQRQLLANQPRNWWFYLVNGQQRLSKALSSGLPEPAASLAGPLVWGGAGRLSAEWRQRLAITGLSHITAVSGFNISLLITLFVNNLIILGWPRRWATIIASLVITAYVLVIGAPASAVRAGLLGLLMLWGQQFGRLGRVGHLLLVSAALMLAFNPFYFWGDLGFSLSFAAVFGLLYWAEYWQKWLKYLPLLRQPLINENLAVTLAAQMWTWPLIFWQFGQISIIAPLANLLVIWALPWLTVFLLLASPLAWLWPAAGVFIFAPAGWLLNILLAIIANLASWPGAGFLVEWPDSWRVAIILVYYGTTLFLLRKLSQKSLTG